MKLLLKRFIQYKCIEELELTDDSAEELLDYILGELKISVPGKGTYTIEKADGLLKFKNRGWAASNDLGWRLKFEED